MIGEAVPGGEEKEEAARQKLVIAGYRWPSAVSVFLGIKGATAVMLAAAGVWGAVTFRPDAELFQLFLAAICGLGLWMRRKARSGRPWIRFCCFAITTIR